MYLIIMFWCHLLLLILAVLLDLNENLVPINLCNNLRLSVRTSDATALVVRGGAMLRGTPVHHHPLSPA